MKHIFVLSLPRSGSTLLSRMLDTREDVISIPESFFPAAMDLVEDNDYHNSQLMAALFVTSCSDGSPLTFDEALPCIANNRMQTLDQLATAIARKTGRDPSKISVVVWKFTRMVGCWRWASANGGLFLVLNRPLLNIYESQFRVDFGIKNRNPARFALFASSYLKAFESLPPGQTIQLEYASIPDRIDEISDRIGSAGKLREDGKSAVDLVAGKNPWHSEIGKSFRNDDELKRKNVGRMNAFVFRIAMFVLGLLPVVALKARKIADKRQFEELMQRARAISSNTP